MASQTKGFLPACILSCAANDSALWNRDEHCPHGNGRFFIVLGGSGGAGCGG